MRDTIENVLFAFGFVVLFLAMVGIASIGLWLSYLFASAGFSNNYLDIYDIFATFTFCFSVWALFYAFVQAHEEF